MVILLSSTLLSPLSITSIFLLNFVPAIIS
jgi:hypothetical protein